ncbi:hypothetical protein ARMSODRAFT_998509 [Armillaria solidipes]|uniref:Protein kinase domain-containing protein n=1 Tax=Armillaria solidipes TaxID=1076256 RepID=A0A2H3CJ68_9AGAR|nr:hypothetical protein ARMSODRAFT_998509 [Armillaria solidipes]
MFSTPEIHETPRSLDGDSQVSSLYTLQGSSSGSPAPPTATTDPQEQKSFHHARLPMIPTLPLPQHHSRDNSAASPSTTASNCDAASISDTKCGCFSRGSATGWRKRLFSNSLFGRHSASQALSPQEDKQFVLNLPVNSDYVGGSSLSSQTTLSPSSFFWDERIPDFWDESTPDVSISPGQEYVPQPILSPAKLLEVEANMQDALNSERHSDTGSLLRVPLPPLPPLWHSRHPSPAHHNNVIKPLSPRSPLARLKLGDVVETNLRQNMMIRMPSITNDGFDRDHQHVAQQEPPPKVNAKQQRIGYDASFLNQSWASPVMRDELSRTDKEIDGLLKSLKEVKPIKNEAEDSRRSQWWQYQEDYTWAQQEHLGERPSLYSWTQINLNDEETDVRTQIQGLLCDVMHPWRTMHLLPQSAEVAVIDVLQQELDDVSCPDEYRAVCMKCLRTLSKARNIVPSSFSCRDVTREGENPIWGGGFSDIWKGRLHNTQVCLKVLRIFISGEDRAKVIRDFCQEVLVWRQLQHPNVLPFLGVSEDLFAPSYCLISPWMVNGNIMSYLQAHPDHDRLTSVVQVAEAMEYLHNLDPPIIHADIRGANILVTDDQRCCLADFGLSLIAESQNFNTTSGMRRGSLRWLAPKYILPESLDQSYIAARDSYAYGCTVIEVFTGKPSFSEIQNDHWGHSSQSVSELHRVGDQMPEEFHRGYDQLMVEPNGEGGLFTYRAAVNIQYHQSGQHGKQNVLTLTFRHLKSTYSLTHGRIVYNDESQVWESSHGRNKGKSIDEVTFTAAATLEHINLTPVPKSLPKAAHSQANRRGHAR